MKLPIFSGPPKRRNSWLIIRRVSGDSMSPTLLHGKIIVAQGLLRQYKVGDIVVLHYKGVDMIKCITDLRNDEVYVEGDNPGRSTDSRQFGWVSVQLIVGVVLWPNRRHPPVRQKL